MLQGIQDADRHQKSALEDNQGLFSSPVPVADVLLTEIYTSLLQPACYLSPDKAGVFIYVVPNPIFQYVISFHFENS